MTLPARTLADLELAIRSAWSLETCDDVDVVDWSIANPARGQCGATALTLHDLLGGELLEAEVLNADGSRQGHHLWNRLTSGVEVDLTLEQLSPTEFVQPPHVVQRPVGPPGRGAVQYLLLRARVFAALGMNAPPDQQ